MMGILRIREITRMRRDRDSKMVSIISLWLLIMSNVVKVTNGLSVTVQEEECVYEYVLYEGDIISGSFAVIDHEIFWNSDHPGIDFTGSFHAHVGTKFYADHIAKRKLGHSLKGTPGDKFKLSAPRSGMFKFCFHNAYGAPETVSFYIHVGHIPNQHNLAKDEHLDPVYVKISELREAMESVTGELKYLKARDSRHRHTNESTRKRVIIYTLGEYVLLVLVNCLQGVFIRRLFSNSVRYNRVCDMIGILKCSCISNIFISIGMEKFFG